jgi:high-affinity Fe2+/Pb2+ permease
MGSDRKNDVEPVKNWLRSWLFMAICCIFGILLAVAILRMGGSQYNAVFAFFAVLLLLMLVKRK